MDKRVKKWFENDELFGKELAIGRKWEGVVADRLNSLGFSVVVPECNLNSIECKTERRAAAVDAVDLYVNGLIIEVKSRAYKFTCADDFPYDTIAIDTKSGFDAKTDKPAVYICISQITGDWTALDVEKTREHWVVSKRFDRKRGIPVVSYDCHKRHWGDVEETLLGLKDEGG